MSEKDNLRIVQQGYEALGRDDLRGLLALLTGDIEWHDPEIENVAPEPSRVVARTPSPDSAIAKAADIERFEPLHFIAQGDRLIVLGSEAVRAKSTKRAYSTEWAHSFTLRDGKIPVFQEYTDTNRIAGGVSLRAPSGRGARLAASAPLHVRPVDPNERPFTPPYCCGDSIFPRRVNRCMRRSRSVPAINDPHRTGRRPLVGASGEEDGHGRSADLNSTRRS